MSDLLMKRTASLSRCATLRWWLGRRWAVGRTVCWIMLNPSTADSETDDPTLRRIIRFSQSWGFGALAVVNLYPFVRFRAVFGLGFLGFILWSQGDSTAITALANGAGTDAGRADGTATR